jgi:PKD repeat protein
VPILASTWSVAPLGNASTTAATATAQGLRAALLAPRLPGSYNATLTVWDAHGAVASDWALLAVSEAAPAPAPSKAAQPTPPRAAPAVAGAAGRDGGVAAGGIGAWGADDDGWAQEAHDSSWEAEPAGSEGWELSGFGDSGSTGGGGDVGGFDAQFGAGFGAFGDPAGAWALESTAKRELPAALAGAAAAGSPPFGAPVAAPGAEVEVGSGDLVAASSLFSAPRAAPRPRAAIALSGGGVLRVAGDGSPVAVRISGKGSLNAVSYDWSATQTRPYMQPIDLGLPQDAQPAEFEREFTPGEYLITLTVSGPGGREVHTMQKALVVSANQPPAADAGGPYLARPGGRIQLSAARSRDPDGDALTYSWTLSKAGSEAPIASFSQAAPAFSINAPGSYLAKLTVRDAMGGSSTATAPIHVDYPSPPPPASLPPAAPAAPAPAPAPLPASPATPPLAPRLFATAGDVAASGSGYTAAGSGGYMGGAAGAAPAYHPGVGGWTMTPPSQSVVTRVAPAPPGMAFHTTAAGPGGGGPNDGGGGSVSAAALPSGGGAAPPAPRQAAGGGANAGMRAVSSGYGLGSYHSGLGGTPMTVGSPLSPLQTLAPNSQWSQLARGQPGSGGGGGGQVRAASLGGGGGGGMQGGNGGGMQGGGVPGITSALTSGSVRMPAVEQLSTLLKATTQVGAVVLSAWDLGPGGGQRPTRRDAPFPKRNTP